MAKNSSGVHPNRSPKKRKGIHSKCKSSKSKRSKLYKKKYKGQGR